MTGSFRMRLWRREALTRDLVATDHRVGCAHTTTLRSRAGHSILSRRSNLPRRHGPLEPLSRSPLAFYEAATPRQVVCRSHVVPGCSGGAGQPSIRARMHGNRAAHDVVRECGAISVTVLQRTQARGALALVLWLRQSRSLSRPTARPAPPRDTSRRRARAQRMRLKRLASATTAMRFPRRVAMRSAHARNATFARVCHEHQAACTKRLRNSEGPAFERCLDAVAQLSCLRAGRGPVRR